MFDIAPHEQVYECWRQHNGTPLQGANLIVFEALRNTYPSYHITLTLTARCDLLGFASAGHATATQIDTPLTHSIRAYKAPRYRITKEDGKLQDWVSLGCWSYTWNDTEYLVYNLEYKEPFTGEHKYLFVLHPDHPNQRLNAATDALLVASGKWTKELHGEIFVYDTAEWLKSKDLWKSVDGASWDDVILDPPMKANLIHDVQDFFDAQSLYHAMNVPWKRGIILHGVPGNGKTLSIKALINSLYKRVVPIPALYVKSLDACQGPKWSIQNIFSKARTMAPCLLVFEDLDSMVTAKTRSYFLNEVDGLESNEGILMIGSTNHLDLLDPAITKRPSRFDRKYHFQLPGEAERTAYALYWARKFAGSNDVDFPEALCPLVAKITEDFSFAYLKEMFVASLLILARGANSELDDANASNGVKPSASEATNGTVVEEEAKVKESGADTGGDKPTEIKSRKQLPVVDIPEDLKGNVLLRIITKQAATLLGEMDNSDNAAAGACLVSGSELIPRVARYMARGGAEDDD